MASYPESEFYSFTYNNGWAASFAEITVLAQAQGGTGRKILVFDGYLDGNGTMQRIKPQPSWIKPELWVYDRAAGQSKGFPLFASAYKLDWDRPAPFGEFDGLKFDAVGDWLEHLAMRYEFLSNMLPGRMDLRLTRVGSPAEWPRGFMIFLQLKSAMDESAGTLKILDPNDSTALKDRVEEARLKHAKYAMWAISGEIPIGARTFGRHNQATLALAYLQMLRAIATKRSGLSLPRILKALARTLPTPSQRVEVIAHDEDWALAGALIFTAGLMVYGYKFGGLDQPEDTYLVKQGVSFRPPGPARP
jgi:hypothetical protein